MSYGGFPYGGAGYAGSDVAEIPSDNGTHLAVEVSLTTAPLAEPAWVDITTDVRSWSTSRGRQRALERFQPGRATITLSNLSRQYDSAVTANIKPNKRIRIRETFSGVTHPVFDGFIDRWELDYPGTGKDAVAVVTATDAMKLLARTDMPTSVYRMEVEHDTPRIWWRMDEDLARFRDNQALNQGSLGPSHDGGYFNAPKVGGDTLIVNDPGASLATVNAQVAADSPSNGVTIEPGTFDLTASLPFTVETWSRQTDASATQGYVWAYVNNADGTTPGLLARADDATFVDKYIFAFFNTGLTTYYGVETAAGFAAQDVGVIHHIVCSVSAGGVMTMWIDGVQQTTAITGGGGSTHPLPLPSARALNIGHSHRNTGTSNQTWTGDLDEVAVYNIVLPSDRIAAHYAAGSAPWQGDAMSTRVGRALDIAGWPASLRELDTGSTTLQSAMTDGQTVLEHCQKVGETEYGGLWFVNRAGSVRFVGRTAVLARVPSITFGDLNDGVEVGYTAFVPDDGDLDVRNVAVISRLNGAAKTSEDATSISALGRSVFSLEGLLHGTEAYSSDYAAFIVAQFKDQRRSVRELTVGPAIAGQESIVYPAMLGLELGDVVTVKNRPPGGGAVFSQVCAVEGIEHAGAPGGQRTARLILSPDFT